MFKSSFIKRILAAVLLTGAIAADAFQIGVILSDGQVVQEAKLINIKSGHKVYDDQGNFKACEIGGTGCLIIFTAMGDMTFSSEGLNVQ